MANKVIKNLEKANAWVRDAHKSSARGDGLREKRDWNGAIEAYQHCIELSVKSLFQLWGKKHPRKHDPTKEFEEIFELTIERLMTKHPEVYDLHNWKRRLARLRWISIVSAKFHELSMYPFCGVPASDFFNKEDADYLQRIAADARFVPSFLSYRISRSEWQRKILEKYT